MMGWLATGRRPPRRRNAKGKPVKAKRFDSFDSLDVGNDCVQNTAAVWKSEGYQSMTASLVQLSVA